MYSFDRNPTTGLPCTTVSLTSSRTCTYPSWAQSAAILAEYGTMQLEFKFDTKDGIANSTSGVFVDDLKIESTCVAVPCVNNGDCNDTFGFSTESCEGGVCAFTLP